MLLPGHDPALATARRPSDLLVATVASIDPVTVTEGHGEPVAAVSAIPNWALAVGDRVLVSRAGAELFIIGTLTKRPSRATVHTVSGDTATVHADDQSWRVGWVGTAAPAPGMEVVLAWDGAGGTILGQAGKLAPPPPAEAPTIPARRDPVSLTLTPVAQGSWRSGALYRTDQVRQGHWGSSPDSSGAWIYGDVFGGVRGMTCVSAEIDLTRLAGSGASAARPIHLRLHNHATLPDQLQLGTGFSDITLATGASGRFAIPTVWGDVFARGEACGVGVAAVGTADYMALAGGPTSGVLHLRYE